MELEQQIPTMKAVGGLRLINVFKKPIGLRRRFTLDAYSSAVRNA